MYQVENAGQVARSSKLLGWLRLSRGAARSTVISLGFTSLFTDISTEMITTTLPLYLMFMLRVTPLEYGLVDGLYQGGAALVRILSGLIADRWGRYKAVAASGYALSAGCKIALLAVGNAVGVITGLVLVDRIGKGIRTAPRDAMISLSTPAEQLGAAFGVHRALDTAGAMIGPVVAFGILALAPAAFDAIFVVSFCFALIGLAVLLIFVPNSWSAKVVPERRRAVSVRALATLLSGRSFRALVLIATMLSLVTISDTFLYLGLQRRLSFSIGYFPLLYVATALVYMLLAAPVGWLADRWGRGRVFVAGHVLLIVSYTSLLVPLQASALIWLALLLFGAYYAATDGVLAALASALLPPEIRASGLALLVTATSLGRLISSVLFGTVWTWWGVQAAVGIFIAGLGVATVAAAIAFTRLRGALADG